MRPSHPPYEIQHRADINRILRRRVRLDLLEFNYKRERDFGHLTVEILFKESKGVGKTLAKKDASSVIFIVFVLSLSNIYIHMQGFFPMSLTQSVSTSGRRASCWIGLKIIADQTLILTYYGTEWNLWSVKVTWQTTYLLC